MAYNRSLRFYGIGVGSTPVEITAKFNGVEVYSGPVPTVSTAVFSAASLWDINEIMFTIEDSAEYNTNFSGVVPMSISVTAGNMVVFNDIKANYWGTVPNPAFTPEQYVILDNPAVTVAEAAPILISAANPPFSAEEETLLITLLEAFPDRSEELNNLREAHNVAYSVHSPDSWEDCMDPVPDPNADYPWYVHDGSETKFDVYIISFL